VYGSSVIQLPSAPIDAIRDPINTVFASVFILEQTDYDETFFSKNRMHGVLELELELEETNNNCAMF